MATVGIIIIPVPSHPCDLPIGISHICTSIFFHSYLNTSAVSSKTYQCLGYHKSIPKYSQVTPNCLPMRGLLWVIPLLFQCCVHCHLIFDLRLETLIPWMSTAELGDCDYDCVILPLISLVCRVQTHHETHLWRGKENNQFTHWQIRDAAVILYW